MGIDPGTNIMGYGLVREINNSLDLADFDVIHLQKLKDPMHKLRRIFEETLKLVEKYKPDELAIEAPFYGKNIQSMLKLGRAQGVSMAAALYRDIPIFEYAPRKVKQSITGNGNASKEQVAGMIKTLLKLDTPPKYFDATDGLAVAVCHYFQRNKPGKSTTKTYGSWKAFLSDNPDREG